MTRSAKRSGDPKEEARQNFILARTDHWNAGEYGYTLKCVAVEGVLKLKFTQPIRRQWTLPGEGDTAERRKLLTELAMRHMLDWRTGRLAQPADPTHEPETRAEAEREERAPALLEEASVPTYGEVWRRYIKAKWPGISDDFASWGRSEVRKYYTTMPAEDKKRAPSPNSLHPVLQSMRRVTAFPAYAPDARVTDSEPGDWTAYTNWRRTHPDGKQPDGKPYSYGTIETDYGRLHTAIKFCKAQYRKWWNGAPDPLEGADVVRITADLEEIGEERAQILTRTLRRMGAWRALAAVMFAGGSGRRIGAIGSDLNGFDADALRGSDFEVIHGKLHVTWRAEAAKGEGFGRGDDTLLASRSVALAYRWLRRFHPNPLGPEYPLIWSPADPTTPPSYASLNKAFKDAWRHAFGHEAPRGVAFHAYCRTVVTTLVDALGLSQAAEYTGRTTKTIEKHYKRKRAETQAKTTEVLDQIQREAARKAASQGPKSQPKSQRGPAGE